MDKNLVSKEFSILLPVASHLYDVLEKVNDEEVKSAIVKTNRGIFKALWTLKTHGDSKHKREER